MPTAVVTGATGGVGGYIVEKIAELGYRLVIIARTYRDLELLKDNLALKYNADVTALACDVSDNRAVQEQFSLIKETDILVNCAGILGPVGLFGNNDMEYWAKAIQVNLLGTIYSCNALISKLEKSRKGKIINIGGGGAAFARSHHTAYASAKTAIIRFTETLSMEYPNLDINVIAPGAHRTKMWQMETHDKEPGKWGNPQRLKELIQYLISEKSDGLTGKFIHIYDDWDQIDYRKVGSDYCKLRRIDSQLLSNISLQNDASRT
jgi:NAD(P)-dependent dehydrogenase (short-subunit alcohol dehydrogenase family)